MNAAIRFEPDGYDVTGRALVGRQAAGHGFLRAAVAARAGQPLWGFSAHTQSADAFRQLVASFDPAAQGAWLPLNRRDLLQQIGTLYLPDPSLGEMARLRLRHGPAAFSLCGVTHTTATHDAMDRITELFAAPTMPWDALICTSDAVAETVTGVMDQQRDYLRWRFGAAALPAPPMLPVIPLGIHCTDFHIDAAQRAAARAAFDIGPDDVVALFVGRLSFYDKAHPAAMYRALETAAAQTGKRVTLIQSGWFATDKIKAVFESTGRELCPSVRLIFSDGRDGAIRRQSWAAADLFVSLADNIQETFGLTPLEAMAAGLPVIVTDWNGYKETVGDGVDGYKIPTWMPPAPLGAASALSYEAGIQSYHAYIATTALMVSVDHRVLVDRLTAVIGDADLRRTLGHAGQARARNAFDWSVVYRRYQALWAELARIRAAAAHDPHLAAAPRRDAGRMDPFETFGHYATARIQPATRLSLATGATPAAYAALSANALFAFASAGLPPMALVEKLFALLADGARDLDSVARATLGDIGQTTVVVAILAKMGLVELDAA